MHHVDLVSFRICSCLYEHVEHVDVLYGSRCIRPEYIVCVVGAAATRWQHGASLAARGAQQRLLRVVVHVSVRALWRGTVMLPQTRRPRWAPFG